MTPFRLFDLDYVAMRLASLHIDEMSTLNIALSSKNARQIMKLFKKRIEFIWVNFQESDCVINLKFAKNVEVYWRIKSSKGILKHAEKTDVFELNNMKVESMRYQKKYKYVINSYCEDDLSVCQSIVEVLLDIYRPNQLNYYISRKHNISKLLCFNGLNQVDHLTFIVYFAVSDEEFLLFRQNIHPKKELCFNLVFYKNLNHGCNIEFNYEKLEICSSDWLNREDLFNINCKYAFLKETKLTNEDLNLYFKRWIEGNDSKLEKLKIIMPDDRNLDNMLAGIETKSLEEIIQDKNLNNKTFEFLDFENFKFDGCKGRHLIRKDGNIATVHVAGNKNLNFIVWNEKSPLISDTKDSVGKMI